VFDAAYQLVKDEKGEASARKITASFISSVASYGADARYKIFAKI
jgi:hypothetical protein